jgi:hypothetical protein
MVPYLVRTWSSGESAMGTGGGGHDGLRRSGLVGPQRHEGDLQEEVVA